MTRLCCVVPGCRRTWKGDSWSLEWVCGKHWTMVNKSWRRRYSLVRRRYRRYGAKYADLADKMWERCKRQAIERAMGIS